MSLSWLAISQKMGNLALGAAQKTMFAPQCHIVNLTSSGSSSAPLPPTVAEFSRPGPNSFALYSDTSGPEPKATRSNNTAVFRIISDGTKVPANIGRRTGFNLFCKEQWPKCASENGNAFLANGKLNPEQIGKIVSDVAATWKDLDPLEKQKYIQKAADHNAVTITEFKALPESEQEAVFKKLEVKKKRRAKKLKSEFGVPRVSNISGYMLFLSKRREEQESKPTSLAECNRLVTSLAKEWSDLSEQQKQPYKEQAEEERKKSRAAVKKYVSQMMGSPLKVLETVLPKNMLPKKPKKPVAVAKKAGVRKGSTAKGRSQIKKAKPQTKTAKSKEATPAKKSPKRKMELHDLE